MSDFDGLLERLVLEPGFRHALAADPGRALTGYDLTDDERALLMAELSTDDPATARVEDRVSKAGMFGLASSLTGGLLGGGDAVVLEFADGDRHDPYVIGDDLWGDAGHGRPPGR